MEIKDLKINKPYIGAFPDGYDLFIPKIIKHEFAIGVYIRTGDSPNIEFQHKLEKGKAGRFRTPEDVEEIIEYVIDGFPKDKLKIIDKEDLFNLLFAWKS